VNNASLSVEEIIEEYQHARDEYKRAVGDRDRDYWDGYLAGIEAVLPEVSHR
jgi:hypothetical protein